LPVLSARKYNQILLLRYPIVTFLFHSLRQDMHIIRSKPANKQKKQTKVKTVASHSLLTLVQRQTHSRPSQHWSQELTEPHTSYIRATITTRPVTTLISYMCHNTHSNTKMTRLAIVSQRGTITLANNFAKCFPV